MHSLEGHQHGHTFASHGLQRTTGVAHAIFSKTAADRVGYPACQPFDNGISALRAIAADEIGAV